MSNLDSIYFQTIKVINISNFVQLCNIKRWSRSQGLNIIVNELKTAVNLLINT